MEKTAGPEEPLEMEKKKKKTDEKDEKTESRPLNWGLALFSGPNFYFLNIFWEISGKKLYQKA